MRFSPNLEEAKNLRSENLKGLAGGGGAVVYELCEFARITQPPQVSVSSFEK